MKSRQRKCGMPISAGRSCDRPIRHTGRHGSKLCSRCGSRPKYTKNYRGGLCYECKRQEERERYRKKTGAKERILQKPGSYYVFSCGCAGILPQRGEVNKFAVYAKISRMGDGRGVFQCRLLTILNSSRRNADRYGHKSIDPNIPHSEIRVLMEALNCVVCGQPLVWEFGVGKTPHLHHDHETGNLYGFAHPVCNVLGLALRTENIKLKEENRRLRAQIQTEGIK